MNYEVIREGVDITFFSFFLFFFYNSIVTMWEGRFKLLKSSLKILEDANQLMYITYFMLN